ncbi:hypothetical protein NST38_30645 [Paenibacillus sp. FSL H8-0104]|uniref:hypothetical protein n=1 Tax=Paenibacillus sp. FSL H8-0104 TaxID=2954509 RepID=UPI0030FDAC7A
MDREIQLTLTVKEVQANSLQVVLFLLFFQVWSPDQQGLAEKVEDRLTSHRTKDWRFKRR